MSVLEKFQALYPYEAEHIQEAAMADISKRYFSLLEEGKQQGFVPVFIAFDDILAESMELALEEAEKTDAVEMTKMYLEKAAAIEAPAFFAERLADILPEDREEYFEQALATAGQFSEEDKPNLELSVLFDPQDEGWELREDILLVKLPTDKPYEAFAYIVMGGFNDCPLPEEQVAVCKYWYEKHGAMPAAITCDAAEFYVQKPVRTLAEAQALAQEQVLFCFDLGTQIFEDLNEVAEFIYNNVQWYFWWD